MSDTEHVILVRKHDGSVGFIHEGENIEQIAVFLNLADAMVAAERIPLLKAIPYQIVELDEL